MKPLAFRIWDFKSIQDTGECTLSADGITAIAGQNESGKTAVLNALRDFDLAPGEPPETVDYQPDGAGIVHSRVAVKFAITPHELKEIVDAEEWWAPPGFLNAVRGELWITRDLETATFSFEPELVKEWESWVTDTTADSEDEDAETDEDEGATLGVAQGSSSPSRLKKVSAAKLAAGLRGYWPHFLYFDSFEDTLPREIAIDKVIEQVPASPQRKQPASVRVNKSAPSAVKDFIVLAGLELGRMNALEANDKALGNYLRGRSAHITDDFLKYWKQRVGTEDAVDLTVHHHRDAQGQLRLLFFVHDKVDQYPDQRSKGFLWFLSFFLRLAAAEKHDDGRRLLLVDEPGTFLHARAQQDVLHLFEDRIAPQDQVIYTTHSPYLLPADKLHRVRVAVKTPKKGTLVLDRLTHPVLRGKEFADSLSPVLTMIGLDVTTSLSFVGDKNILVEGISDHYYVTSWARLLRPQFLKTFNLFPGTGAPTLPILASLFIGWRLAFAVLLDRDDAGARAKLKLTKDLGIPEARVVQPKDAVAIEDLLSDNDFRILLTQIDATLELADGETPTAAIKRMKLDKVLLSRTFAEGTSAKGFSLDSTTKQRVKALLDSLENALSA